jgi:hypothetical protein
MSGFEPSGAKVQIGNLHLLLAVEAGFGDLALPSVDLGSTQFGYPPNSNPLGFSTARSLAVRS